MEYLRCLPFSSISGSIEYYAETKPEINAILYPNPHVNSQEYACLTYKQFNNVINHLAVQFSKYVHACDSVETTITCGLLLPDDIRCLLAQYALLKLPNVIIFPISVGNSQAAVKHLLKETNTTILLTISPYAAMLDTIQSEQGAESLKVLLLDNDEFKTEYLLQKKDIECIRIPGIFSMKRNSVDQFDQVVIILHSSGSTAFPKPNYLTNRYFLINTFVYTSINAEFWKQDDIILLWGSLCHLMAFYYSTCAFRIGCTYAMPLCASFPPKPKELVHNMQMNHRITVLVTVPSLLEQLVQELLVLEGSRAVLEPLQKLRFIMYGGASSSDPLCKILIDNEVVLLSFYGSTESGTVLGKNFDPYDKRWKHMQIPDIRKPYFRIEAAPNAQSSNEKILIHLPNDPFVAENVFNASESSYTIGDVFLEDPPNSEQYLILGRNDDTLVHTNGKKTNPNPIENIIRCSPLVKQVAVVGHNQICAAALIELNIEEASRYKLEDIEQKIWEVVEQANRMAPSHSYIIRQLIKILPAKEILPVTQKGNIMRQRVNEVYFTLIIDMFDKFLNQHQQDEQNNGFHQVLQSRWTIDTIKQCLQTKLVSVLQTSSVQDVNNFSCSIFDFGINSLQTMELRHFICKNICEIPTNFLFECSSINEISENLSKLLQRESAPYIAAEIPDPYHYILTEQIIDKYIHLIKNELIKTHGTKKNQQSERVFIVTGGNGSLGSFIIQDLLKQSELMVKRVYCLLRGSNTEQRFFESLSQRQMEISIFKKSLGKRLVILPLAAKLYEERLGQTTRIYNELQHEATDIIHTAWKMDFNQTVKDFEHDSIFSVYNLLKLAAMNNMQFHFISSIASAGSRHVATVKEEPLPRNPEIALAQGYGQSKYVSEHISAIAMNLWNVPVNIYRIGQISGDTKHGVWNITEMIPMMIYAGAGQLKQMPYTGQDITWIPVDICSTAIVELSLKSSFDISKPINERIYHLLNPDVTLYDDYLNLLRSAGLSFEVVSLETFVQSILTARDVTNPLIKITPFFEQSFGRSTLLKLPKFELVKTIECCETLKTCPRIDLNLVHLYLNYWRKCGVLTL